MNNERAAHCLARAEAATHEHDRLAWRAAAEAWESLTRARREPTIHGQAMDKRYRLGLLLSAIREEKDAAAPVCEPACATLAREPGTLNVQPLAHAIDF